MMEWYQWIVLFCQSAVVALEALWLTVAIRNHRNKSTCKEDEFDRILSLDKTKERIAEIDNDISTQRTINLETKQRFFRRLVTAEIIVAVLLWLAALFLFLGIFGVVAGGFANTLAHIAVLGFITIWAGLLIASQWYRNKDGIEAAQQTHFFLLIWGILTLIYLSVS